MDNLDFQSVIQYGNGMQWTISLLQTPRPYSKREYYGFQIARGLASEVVEQLISAGPAETAHLSAFPPSIDFLSRGAPFGEGTQQNDAEGMTQPIWQNLLL